MSAERVPSSAWCLQTWRCKGIKCKSTTQLQSREGFAVCEALGADVHLFLPVAAPAAPG